MIRTHTDRGGILATLDTPTKVEAVQLQGIAARVHLTKSDGLVYTHGTELRDLAGLREIAAGLVGARVQVGHDKGAPAIGFVTAARIDQESRVIATLMIHDKAGIARIKSSRTPVELSLGYAAHADENDFQRDIVVDHLAVLVDGLRARCGDECAVRVHDSSGYVAEARALDKTRADLTTRWTGLCCTACGDHDDESTHADEAAASAALRQRYANAYLKGTR